MIMTWPVSFVDGQGSRPIRGQRWILTTNQIIQEKITLDITNDNSCILTEKMPTREGVGNLVVKWLLVVRFSVMSQP